MPLSCEEYIRELESLVKGLGNISKKQDSYDSSIFANLYTKFYNKIGKNAKDLSYYFIVT